MSWLSEGLKRNHLDVLNKIAKPIQAIANPIVDAIPVVGQVKQGLEAVGNYVPGAPKPVTSTGGLPNIGLPGGGSDPSAVGQGAWDQMLASLPKGSNGLPGIVSVLDFLKGNNGLNALGTAQGVNAALLGQKSSQYAKDALGSVNSNWNANAPLRDAGRAGMLAPKPSVDTSFLPGIRKANVFARGG